jgi:hypothetical protein
MVTQIPITFEGEQSRWGAVGIRETWQVPTSRDLKPVIRGVRCS